MEKTYEIEKTMGVITIDGKIKEQDWNNAQKVGDFTKHYPTDTGIADAATIVRMTYDDKYLYVAAECYSIGENYVVSSLNRDFSFPVTDAFAIFLNPSNDKTNGYSFAVSPYGVQREGLVSTGGQFGVTTSWDQRWFCASERHGKMWITEMAIPFKSLRFPSNQPYWSINFARQDLQQNENSTWMPIIQTQNVASFAASAKLIWPESPQSAGMNVNIIPYALGGMQYKFEDGKLSESNNLINSGLDAKIGIGSGLNLDLTVNPDFSQVNADPEVVNLDRFNIFLPEQREFFLENSDLFSNFGFSRIRPFFSRRIGINDGEQIPILAGARLSGNVNKNWRVGLMNVQTAADNELGLAAENFTVGAFQRKVLQRSSIGGIVVNRASTPYSETDSIFGNTNGGMDFNILSKNGKWQGKIFQHASLDRGINKWGFANASWLQYASKEWYIAWNHEFVDANYNAETGFVPRTAYYRLEPIFRRHIYFEGSKLNRITLGVYNSEHWDLDFNLTDLTADFFARANFVNYSDVGFAFVERYVRLTSSFDLGGILDEPIPIGEHRFRRIGGFYSSDFRKPIAFSFSGNYGGFYNGENFFWRGDVIFRKRPFGSLAFEVNQNRITIPGNDLAIVNLVKSRLEVSFNKDVALSAILQYNHQSENIGLNARIRWRFKPVSDIFLVYTDNYTDEFNVTSRGFAIKLNYWFTI